MHNSKKTIKSIICILIMLIVINTICLGGYYETESQPYMDSKLREELAGNIDFIVIGASHAWNGFDTYILDEKIPCNSYNLSNGLMPMEARKQFIMNETARNPVNTVVVEITFDAMAGNASEGMAAEGDEMAVARLGNNIDRLKYMINNLSIDSAVSVYSRALIRGVQAWANILSGSKVLDREAKGFIRKSPNDMTVSETLNNIDKELIDTSKILDKNVTALKEIIRFCKENDIRIIMAVTPITNLSIKASIHKDEFYKWLEDFSKEQDCEFYDFNLLKNKQALFSDKTSFLDFGHLAEEGAKIFTNEFATVINDVRDGKDVSDRFYTSYKEAYGVD